MKKILILCLSIILLFIGCSLDNTPLKGELVINIGDSSRSSLTSGETVADIDTSYYVVKIGNNDSFILDDGTYIRKTIDVGSYDVIVEAYNASDELIGEGKTSVTVASGKTTTCAVVISEKEGNGTLKIDLDRDIDIESINNYIFALIYKINENAEDEYVKTISYINFLKKQNRVDVELSNGKYYIVFYHTYDKNYCDEINSSISFCGAQSFRIVSGKQTYISGWADYGDIQFRPHVEFTKITNNPEKYGPFEISYKLLNDSLQPSYVSIRSSNNINSNENGKIEGNIIKVNNLASDVGNQILIADIGFGSGKSFHYFLGEYDVSEGRDYYIYTNSDNITENTYVNFDIRPYSYSENAWKSIDWYLDDNIIEQTSTTNERCSINKFSAGDHIITAKLNMKDDSIIEVTYPFTAKPSNENLINIGFGLSNITDNKKVELNVGGMDRTNGQVTVYLCDKNGNKLGEGNKVIKRSDYDYIVTMDFPNNFQYGEIYLLVESENSSIIKKLDIGGQALNITLSKSANGYYSKDDMPSIVLEGLEHYNDCTFDVSYHLGAADTHYVDNYSKPIQIELPNNAPEGSYTLHVKVEIFDKDGKRVGERSSSYINFNFIPGGQIEIPCSKVYLALVSNVDLSGNLIFEYRILTLNSDSYYFFRASATDNNSSNQFMEYGSGNYNNSLSTFNINVKSTYGSSRAVECEVISDTVIRIDGINYTLLNKNVSNIPTTKYEGAWEIPSVEISVPVLHTILDKYVNNYPAVKESFPNIENFISVGFTEGLKIDISAIVNNENIKLGVIADMDLNMFDKAISLADVFKTFAEVNLPFTVGSGDNISISGIELPTTMKVSDDGSVLIVYIYKDNIVIPFVMSRATEYKIPSNSKSGFTSDKYITISQIKELLNTVNNECPDFYLGLSNMISTSLTVSGEKTEFAGCWNVYSDEISALDGKQIGVYGGSVVLTNNDGIYYGNFDDSNGTISLNDGSLILITDRRVSYGTLYLTVTYDNNGTTASGEIWLEKYSDDAIDTLLEISKLNGSSLNSILFSTSGDIVFNVTEEGEAKSIEAGEYTFDSTNGLITIKIRSDIFNKNENNPSYDSSFGIRLSIKENEILIFEKFKDGLPNGEFGIKLVDSI